MGETRGALIGVAAFLGLIAGTAAFKHVQRSISTSNEPSPSMGDTAGPIGEHRFLGEELIPPRPAPDFVLVDRTGQPFEMRDQKGKIVLLSFAYTSCPSICPLLYKTFSEVEKEFPGRIDGDIVLAFITLDPEADTPERMSDTVKRFGARWHFLTGEMDTLTRVWEDYHVYRKKEGLLVDHAGLTYLVDGNGLIRIRYGGTPPASALAADVKKMFAARESGTSPIKRIASGAVAGEIIGE